MPFDGVLYEPDDPILRVLRATKERIRDPRNWCQGARRGPDGRLCVIGAIHDVLGVDWENPWTEEALVISDILARAAKEKGFQRAPFLNDNSDHPTVMAMFDLAEKLYLADRAQEMRRAEIMEAAYA